MGARPADILITVLREATKLSVLGVAFGILIAYVASRLLTYALFGVSQTDPSVFASAASILFLVSLLASAVPAIRASRIDPSLALRLE
jgi:ABC-type antimicrobial peptide transport system permease subunit